MNEHHKIVSTNELTEQLVISLIAYHFLRLRWQDYFRNKIMLLFE